jgi:hypothetical protein
VETAELQRLDQADSALNTGSSSESPIPAAESSGQTLATASASSMPDLSDGTPAIVDISNLKTTKIVDKRLGPSGVEYKCEFEPFWLATDLVETVQMGCIRIGSYENGLTRARRLGTASKIALSYILIVSNSTASATPFNRIK